MSVAMYMGQPLHGQKPNIAIDLYDSSLNNLAPSYLTNKLNEKLMNDLSNKSGTIKVLDNGNTIEAIFDDGTKEVLKVIDGTTYESKVYSKKGVILQDMVTTIDDRTGKIRTDVRYDGSVNGVVNFADASWEEIGVMLVRHYTGDINLADFWSVGDTKLITYSSMVANGVDETHKSLTQKIVILGFDHDTISGGRKSAITLGFLNGLGNPGYMHPTNTNVGGWSSSNRRAWCNKTFFYSLPPVLRKLIKPVDKLYSNGNMTSVINTCSDKCFLLSESEIVGPDCTMSYGGEGDQYPFFIGGESLKKKQNDTVSGYDNWFTRSASKADSNQYVYVESDGDINVCDANSVYQIVPAFCI